MKFDNTGSGMYFEYTEEVDCQSNHFTIPADGPKWKEIVETTEDKKEEVSNGSLF